MKTRCDYQMAAPVQQSKTSSQRWNKYNANDDTGKHDPTVCRLENEVEKKKHCLTHKPAKLSALMGLKRVSYFINEYKHKNINKNHTQRIHRVCHCHIQFQ